MRISPLHELFGAEIQGVDLREVTAEAGYPEIRSAFETHSLLVFRNQKLDEATHLAFASLFGPLENRSRQNVPDPPLPVLTNVRGDKSLAPEDDRQVLALKANQLWHTDSTFLPNPALVNVLRAELVPSRGGGIEFASTRAAWRDMPTDLSNKIRNAIIWHRYSHSRAKISKELAADERYTSFPDQAWRAIWPNPVNGEESLYIASHSFAIDGMGEEEGQALIDELIAWATREEYVYAHQLQAGDVLVWDERATLHRGRPWPYDEARTIYSVCASVTERDGLDMVRPSAEVIARKAVQ